MNWGESEGDDLERVKREHADNPDVLRLVEIARNVAWGRRMFWALRGKGARLDQFPGEAWRRICAALDGAEGEE